MEGWIKLHRKFLIWEWYDDSNTFRLFIHLLLRTNHKDKKWHGILVKSGSCIVGRKKLAKELKLTEQQIRTSLDKLKSTNEITIKTTNKYSVVSIKRWKAYQQNNQQIPNKQPTNNQQITTNKNDKNVNNVKKIELPKIKPSYKKMNLIAIQYNVPMSFVESKWDDLLNYCRANNKTYQNYFYMLKRFVKKDAEEVRRKHAEGNKKTAIDARAILAAQKSQEGV